MTLHYPLHPHCIIRLIICTLCFFEIDNYHAINIQCDLLANCKPKRKGRGAQKVPSPLKGKKVKKVQKSKVLFS